MQVMHYMADGTIRPPKPGELFAGYAWLLHSSTAFPPSSSSVHPVHPKFRTALQLMLAEHGGLPAGTLTLLAAEAEFHLDKAPEAIRDAMNRKGGSKVMLVG